MHVAELLSPNETTLEAFYHFQGYGKTFFWWRSADVVPRCGRVLQGKSRIDPKISCDWAEETLKQTTADNSKFGLFCDSLTAQCKDEFKEEVLNINGVVWHGVPTATDLWQPIDSGYDELLKVLMTQQHNTWLEDNSNAERWYGN